MVSEKFGLLSNGKPVIAAEHNKMVLNFVKMKEDSEVAQSCLTLHNPVDCSLPGPSIHGIFQAIVVAWGGIAFFRTL